MPRRIGSNCLVALVLFGGFVLLTASPAANLAQRGLPPELLAANGIGHARRFLPPDSVIVGCVHVDLMRATSSYRELEKAYPFVKEVFSSDLELDQLTSSSVTTVVLGGRPEHGLPIAIISTHKPLILEDQLRSAYPEQIYVTETIGMHRILVPDGDDQNWMRSYYQADAHTLVTGDRRMLQQVLTRQRDCVFSPTLEAALDAANFSQHLTLILDLKSMSTRHRDELRANALIDKRLAESIESLTFNVDFSAGAGATLRAVCTLPKQAEDLKKSCNLLLGLGRQSGAIPRQFHPLLAALKLSHDGRHALASWQVDEAKLCEQLKLLNSAD